MPKVKAARTPVPNPARRTAIGVDLLAWYDRHGRVLPWRSPPGVASDPYAVWLSEVMLQQTTVAAVKSYYLAFLARWPTVADLAAAPVDEVMKMWAGLGYYSRARNLHACAIAVVRDHGGRFPDTEQGLRALPGIGAYTAAAIAAIAFDRRAVVVDGNVERVMARLDLVETPLPQAKPVLWAAMDAATPDRRCGDFAQAMMDLGATICTPRSPACILCPLRPHCRAAAAGRVAELPRKLPKKAVPTRGGAVFFVTRAGGQVLVATRPAQGLFGGMTEFPGTAWSEGFVASPTMALPPGVIGPLKPLGQVTHGLTHFTLVLDVFAARCTGSLSPGQRWVDLATLGEEALPTLMRKVADLAINCAQSD